MIELTEPLQRALDAQGNEPLRLIDPRTQQTYTLVSTEVYERIKGLLGEEDRWAEESFRSAMEVFAREGWDDPRMDAYDALDPRKPS
jgi:hypothetical protein